MSQPILIRGFEGNVWFTIFRVVGFVLIGLGAYLISIPVPHAWLASCAGAVLLGVVEWIAWHGRKSRVWFIDSGQGFVLQDRFGERTFFDDDVEAASLSFVDHYTNGELKAQTRHFMVWMKDLPQPEALSIRVPVQAFDPLANLRKRLMDRLQAKFQAELERGGEVAGEGWRLTRNMLTMRNGTLDKEYRLEDLTAVDVFDQHISIWITGQEAAAHRVPVQTRNAYLLLLLLSQQLEKRPSRSEAPTQGMGRILFERKQGPAVAIFWGIAALAALGFGMYLLAETQETIWGVVLVVGSVACGLAAWAMKVGLFRCHQFGVYQRTMTGEKSLRYEDIASFSYNAVRQFVNGAYTGTTFSFTFTPLAGSASPSISYSVQLKNADDELDELRNHISRVIAARMATQLAETGTVYWTPNIRFLKHGLEFRPKGLLGRKEAQQISYEQIYHFDLQQGHFHLWNHQSKNSILQEPVSEPNFFPGYFLLVNLFTPDDTPPAAENEGKDEDIAPDLL